MFSEFGAALTGILEERSIRSIEVLVTMLRDELDFHITEADL